jgi:hypothetical protein
MPLNLDTIQHKMKQDHEYLEGGLEPLASTYNPTTFCLLKKQGYVCFHHDKFY